MPEPLWYYSHDGRERGPVPMAKLLELTAAGTVKPNDLVWQEGMADWTPASRVAGLFPTAPPASSSSTAPPKSAHGAGDVFRGALAGLVGPNSRRAQWLLISGIVLVVAARGCDTLNQRNVGRMAAKQAAARQQFDDQWETQRLGIQQQIDKLGAKTPISADDHKTIADLRTKLTELLKQQGESRKTLTEGEWRNLEIAARNAKWDFAMWAYWHEMLFVVGAIAFTVGLILVGFGSQGPERWIALAMLAIIAYSLFVEGAAWPTGAGTP
ncbi:MAG: DUF4339 domain-containing protein [Planctomycetes bacterium]|nr:DUF4339 domain-containing protein [Planctomycetota bacterium]